MSKKKKPTLSLTHQLLHAQLIHVLERVEAVQDRTMIPWRIYIPAEVYNDLHVPPKTDGSTSGQRLAKWSEHISFHSTPSGENLHGVFLCYSSPSRNAWYEVAARPTGHVTVEFKFREPL